MADKNKRVTLQNIADAADVSIAVASRAMGNYGYVSAGKKERVRKVADDLGYTPDIVARALKTQKTYCVGVIIADITAHVFTLIVRGIDDVARQNGYHLIICNSDQSPEKEKIHLKELQSRKVDGIIISPTETNAQYINKISRSGIPIILVDRLLPSIDATSVVVDNRLGAYEGVNHLIKHGYKRIGIIKGLCGISILEDRFLGYEQVLKENGITIEEDLIRYGEFDTEISQQATKELLELPEPPDSIFITSEAMILGAILAIKEKKLRIPEDIGIIAFDDPIWAPICTPPLTTIKQPSYTLGTIAAQKIFTQIQNDKQKRDANIVLRTELVIRKSCGEAASSRS